MPRVVLAKLIRIIAQVFYVPSIVLLESLAIKQLLIVVALMCGSVTIMTVLPAVFIKVMPLLITIISLAVIVGVIIPLLLLPIWLLAILLVLCTGHVNHPALWTQTSSICTCGCAPLMYIGSTTYDSTTQGFFITQFNAYQPENNVSDAVGSTTDIIPFQDQALLISVE